MTLRRLIDRFTRARRNSRRQKMMRFAGISITESLEQRAMLTTTIPFDIDGNGAVDPEVDGLLLYLAMSPTPDDTLSRFIRADAAEERNTPAEIREYVNRLNGTDNLLDVDGDGTINPAVDGSISYLAMGTATDATIQQLLLPDATRDVTAIREHVAPMLELPPPNRPPAVHDVVFTIAENSPSGTIVGNVVATDPDIGQTLTYTITEGNTDDTFLINATTGQLTVAPARLIDFEDSPVFNLTISVTDSGDPQASASSNVTVFVQNEFEVTESGFEAVIPLYQYPLSAPGTLSPWWQQILDNASADRPVTVIINPSNGPIDPDIGGSDYDNYITGLTLLRANPNIRITAYIRTDRGNTPAAQVARHLSWYESGYSHPDTGASLIDGIFLDEMATDPAVVGYYETIAQSVRTSTGLAGTLLIGNPGTPAAVEYLDKNTADFFIIREETFANLDAASLPAYVTNPAYDHLKFGAISHTTPSAAQMQEALRQMKLTGLDFGFVTNDTNGNGNPFDATPSFFTGYLNEIHAPAGADVSLTIPENSANQTVVGTVTGMDPDPGQVLTYSITSGNTGGAFAINGASGEITVADSTRLDFETSPQFELTVTLTDDASLSLSSTVLAAIDLSNVNEAPFVDTPIGPITLNNSNTSETIDLATVFADVDDSSLTYRVTSAASPHVTTSINGSVLTLTGVNGQVGSATVAVEAKDSGNLTASTSATVAVDRSNLPALQEVQYALTSDQVVEFGGQNTFLLETNFDESERISVRSTANGVIDPGNVTITSLGGGRHRVALSHESTDFGLTFLQFVAEDLVFADVAAVVLPDEGLSANSFSDTDFELEQEIDDEALSITKTFNDRYLAFLLKEGTVTPERFFSLVRPSSSLDMMTVYAHEGGTFVQRATAPAQALQSSALTSLRSGSNYQNQPDAGRTQINVTVPFGQSEKIDERFVSPGGKALREVLHVAGTSVESIVEEFDEAYNPYHDGKFSVLNTIDAGLLLKNVGEIAGGVALILTPEPATSVIGTAMLIDGLKGLAPDVVAGIAAASERTRFKLDPTAFQSREQLENKLFGIDVTNAVVQTTIGTIKLKEIPGILKKIRTAADAEKNIKGLLKLWKHHLDLADTLWGKFTPLLNTVMGKVTSAGQSVESRAEEIVEFTEPAKAVSLRYRSNAEAPFIAFSESDDLRNDPQIRDQVNELGLEDATERIKGHTNTINKQALDTEAQIEEGTSNETLAETIIAVPESDADLVDSLPAATAFDEGSGDNGDSQEDINSAVKKVGGDPYKKISDAIGVGKKLFDIAKSLQKTVSGVEQLFSSADDSSGYKDPGDDTTYYRDKAQTRTGTPGRDIINTGYKRDVVRSGAGNDRVNTLSGNDEIFAGEGRNSVFAGPGDDFIEDKSGNSFLSAGPGADTIEPGAGNDAIEAGTGHDKIVYRGRDVGNDLLIDPSRSGELRFVDFGIEEIRLRKDKYDLEIILPSNTGLTSNSVKFVSYFEHDAAGWEIIDKLGNHYSMYELTGRITSYEALQTAYGDRGASSTPVYPADVVHLRSVSDASGRLTMHVAEDRRLIGSNSTLTEPNLIVTFEGDSTISGWLSRNGVGSLSASNDLLSRFLGEYSFDSYDAISVVGVGEGGLAAQWFAAVAATRGPAFVNSQLINSPDISGLISQVIRTKVENTANGETTIIANGKAEYVAGFPNLATNYLVNPADWVSRIGLWAGNDELYATWKAWTFDSEPDDGNSLRDIEAVQAAHDPRSRANFTNFDNLLISDMDVTHVRGVVSFLSVNDLSDALSNMTVVLDGEEFHSTVNATFVLIDPDSLDDGFDLQEDTKADRAAFLNNVAADPTAVDEDNGFSLKIDFQASGQQREHLAEGYHEATEDTGYSDGAYGWESTDGVRAGSDKGKATSLERDSVKVKTGTFLIDLDPQDQGTGPGTYNVKITLGDREEIQESLQIYVNGYQADRVSTLPGDFQTRSYQVNTLDSQLRISFRDFGGQHEYFSVNGITVEKVNYRSFIQPSEQLDNDPSITILTQSYELPESNAAIEIFKQAVYAVGTTALTFGAGAILKAAHLGFIATGLGGTFGAGSTFVADLTKGAILSGLKSTLGTAALKAAGWSLVTSVPQSFVSDPTARGILAGITTIGFGVKGIFDSGQPLKDGAGNVILNADGTAQDPRDVLGQVKGGLNVLNGSLDVANTIVASARGQLAEDNTAPWVYEATATLAEMSQRYRLGRLDAAFVPVDLDDVSNAVSNGKTGRKLLKHWQGSRDFLVLDWVPNGVELPDVRVGDHRALVNRGARALRKLIEAYVDVLHESNPEAELDLLLVSHGAGYDINRELVTRLNTSDIADALDYVKLTTLDPVSFNERTGSWYHPEMTNIVDRIDNFFQTETKDQSTGDLEHIGRPLDGRIGGGSAGFYNRQARIFDLESTEELLRFRHWDPNEVNLSTAELTDIEFSPDGSLVAASGKDGIVTVRYVESVPNPEDPDGPPLAAGTEKFIVWGQEAIVRSLAFIQIKVDNEWKDYLLTISAARNPENTDIDKNKVLLTDIETGLPVWQGLDVRGTQVEASPSGKILVSTDADGWAKVWKLDEESVTYTSIGRVAAHPGSGGSYITDVYVINDKYFVTAGGQTNRVKVFEVTEDGAKEVDIELFDNPGEGRVRNLDYDPYNGILAVASGQELSLWNFDRDFGQLTPFTADGRSTTQKFTRQDHVAPVQGVSFSKPGPFC